MGVYHFEACACVCPGNHESAGRQNSGRAPKGKVHLRTILVGAAISASHNGGREGRGHRLFPEASSSLLDLVPGADLG
jgi:hypothetical protein